MITRERIERLRARHTQATDFDGDDCCAGCWWASRQKGWPCDTYAALTLALEAETLRTARSYFEMVREFHEAARLPNGETLGWREDCHYLRVNLHEEEFEELREAFEARDLVKTADAIADLIYVLAGTAATFGINLDAVFAEVHRSNMTKTIDATFREDGKLLKGPKYSPPDIRAALGGTE